MSSTKIVPTTSTTAERKEYSLPSRRFSSLPAELSKLVTDSVRTTADTTAAYANTVHMLEEADSKKEALDKTHAARESLKKLKILAAQATRSNATSVTLSLDEIQTIALSLNDYTHIKLEHDEMSAQKKTESGAEQRLLDRMKKVLLTTMDKQVVVSMFNAFGANPQNRRRRSGKHKEHMERTAAQIAIAAQHDPAIMEAAKLFPRDPEIVKRAKELLADVGKWSEFDIWALRTVFDENNDLTTKAIVTAIFEDVLDLTSELLIPDQTFQRWLSAVCNTYNNVPYHNCLHGADVLQGLHSILENSTLKEALTPTLKFAALTAAVVHDIGHPGRNNKFLVDTSHEIALRYNDRSVLENFHIANALEISKKKDCNIFEQMDIPDAFRFIRSIWIDLILDTDMARHFSVVKELDKKLLEAGDKLTTFKAANATNQSFTLSILLHCVDLGNPTKPWKTYNKWTARVMEEFHSQAETEVEAGRIPSMPRNDKNFILGKFQQGFLRFIRGFFISATMIDGINLSELINNLDENLTLWDVEIAKTS